MKHTPKTWQCWTCTNTVNYNATFPKMCLSVCTYFTSYSLLNHIKAYTFFLSKLISSCTLILQGWSATAPCSRLSNSVHLHQHIHLTWLTRRQPRDSQRHYPASTARLLHGVSFISVSRASHFVSFTRHISYFMSVRKSPIVCLNRPIIRSTA